MYLTAVPIGNAGDITLRALDLLRGADAIACEDTRTTRKLLSLYGIGTKLIPYHEHNAAEMRPQILRRVAEGQAIALVSDAGMPMISDPGFKLARAARDEGLPVTCLPGASAPLTGLLLSGLPSDRFLFAGFPPPKSAARRTFLQELAPIAATLILFEAPHRLPECLSDLAAVLGDREAAVTRELTKLFEEVRRGPLPELAAHYAEAGPPKGEIVIVIGPPGAAARPSEEDLAGQLRRALATMSLRDAVEAVAAATGEPKREVYRLALDLAADED
nr:16S rRNA (cytidine(1402)-2'-O)-methyltransferase [Inquilinus limosus]